MTPSDHVDSNFKVSDIITRYHNLSPAEKQEFMQELNRSYEEEKKNLSF